MYTSITRAPKAGSSAGRTDSSERGANFEAASFCTRQRERTLRKSSLRSLFRSRTWMAGCTSSRTSKSPTSKRAASARLSLSSLPGFTTLDISELHTCDSINFSPRIWVGPDRLVRFSAEGYEELALWLGVWATQPRSRAVRAQASGGSAGGDHPSGQSPSLERIVASKLLFLDLQPIATTGARTNGGTTNNLQGVKHRHYKPCAPPRYPPPPPLPKTSILSMRRHRLSGREPSGVPLAKNTEEVDLVDIVTMQIDTDRGVLKTEPPWQLGKFVDLDGEDEDGDSDTCGFSDSEGE
ncbi:hypothetical protein B0H17DRAFT_1188889 [Mycena rosella]|uniref:Uncharacterized protein n=1 Tax=Mycena rosella TaxID=1033263 RepID=A0AAD7BB57_MYCRO|nr:hypothetical protein B0H17DRAFT_1188889 [Mycena rosella]